ncbi:MAG: MBL fold metallo-hydrolase, partial [Rhodococcus sp. (in: high G+C Gram-positive bacteria)]
AEVTRFYRSHRLERLAQVKAALSNLGQDAKPMQVVRHVYSDIDKKLWPAARMSVKTQLTYLREN